MTDGISTLGIRLGFAVETQSTGTDADRRPTEFKPMHRINAIGGVSVDRENIDASALEDYTEKNIEGRITVDEIFTVTVNLSDGTIQEWDEAIALDNEAQKNGLRSWFEVWSPDLYAAYYIIGSLPDKLPLNEKGQNELETVEIPITVLEVVGYDVGIKPVLKAHVITHEGDVVVCADGSPVLAVIE